MSRNLSGCLGRTLGVISFTCLFAIIAATAVRSATLTITVNAADNLYGAGQITPPDPGGCATAGSAIAPCGGYLPPTIAVKGGDTLTFSVPAGQKIEVDNGDGNHTNDADGVGRRDKHVL